MKVNYDPFGQNEYRAGYLPEQEHVARGRARVEDASGWMGDRGQSAAGAATQEQLAAAGAQAAQARAAGPMAMQAQSRDLAAAYGGAGRAGGAQSAQEYAARMGAAQDLAGDRYAGEVAQYRTMSEAYNDMLKANRQIASANKDRQTNFIQGAVSGIPILGSL